MQALLQKYKEHLNNILNPSDDHINKLVKDLVKHFETQHEATADESNIIKKLEYRAKTSPTCREQCIGWKWTPFKK